MRRIARAKINWTLAITGKREDGYHLLDMLMQTITLCDTLEFTPSDTLSLSVSGDIPVSSGADNLVLRAATLLQRESGVRDGAAIHLQKQIPTGAGLGGGSADAAATLLGLSQLWGLRPCADTLAPLALKLGADVPFFLSGGLARVKGIGEALTPLPGAPAFHLVVVQPGNGLSTPMVYRAYDEGIHYGKSRIRTDAAESALLSGDVHGLSQAMGNALSDAAQRLAPEIVPCIEMLSAHGALKAQITGSGSAVIGLFADESIAADAAAVCAQHWPLTFIAESVADTG